MSFFKTLGKLFGGKARTLADITLDDIRTEQITLQQEQRGIDRDTQKYSQDRSKALAEFQAADAAKNKLEVKNAVRKLRETENKLSGVETRADYVFKQSQLLTGLQVIKENMEFFKRIGVGSIISTMDIGELQGYIAQATIEGTLQQDKLAALLQGVNEGVEALSGAAADADLEDDINRYRAEVETVVAAPSQVTATETSDLDAKLKDAAAVAKELQRTPTQESPSPEKRQ